MDTIHNTAGCFYRALDDEPIFVLLARDPAAAETVRHWVTLRHAMIGRGEKPADDTEVLDAATDTAGAMVAWRYDATDPAKGNSAPRWKCQKPVERRLVPVAGFSKTASATGLALTYDEHLRFERHAMKLGNRFLLGRHDGILYFRENLSLDRPQPNWSPLYAVQRSLQGEMLSQVFDDWRAGQHEKADTIKTLLEPEKPTMEAVKGAFMLTKDTPGVLLEDVKDVIKRHGFENLHDLLYGPDKFESVLLDLETLRDAAARRQPTPEAPEDHPRITFHGMSAADGIVEMAKQAPEAFSEAVHKHMPGFIASNVAPAVATRLRRAKQRLDGEIRDSTWPHARKDRMRAISATIQNEIEVLEAAEETSQQYRGRPSPRGVYWFDEIDALSTVQPSDKPRLNACPALADDGESVFTGEKDRAEFTARLREVLQDTEFWKKQLCVPFDEMSDRYRKMMLTHDRGRGLDA